MLRKMFWIAALLAGCGTQGIAPTVETPGASEPLVLTTPTAAPTTPAAPAAPSAPAKAALRGNAVELAAGGRAVLAVAGQDAATGTLSVAGSAAYHTLDVERTEATLRARERQVASLKPKRRYGLRQAASVEIGEANPFWVLASSSAGDRDVKVTAHTAYVGDRCVVVVDKQVGSALDARAVEMGKAFDAKIYPTDARLFGAPVADGRDPKVTILLSPEVDDHGRGSTLGYFTVLDLFSPVDYPDEPALAHSNSRLMLYVSSAVALHGGPEDYMGTLAHEFQHLINATHKAFGQAKALQEDVWLNEGLSMYAMQANGFGLGSNARVITDHVETYLANPGAWSLTNWDLDPHGSAYGAVYLFVTYLAERVGEDVLKDLVSSAEVGQTNLNARLAAKGLTFDGLFRDWVQALLANDYKSIDLKSNGLAGVAVRALDLPGATNFKVLPRSANYLMLRSTEGGRYDLGLTGAKTSSWLVDIGG
ncbi:MAG: hypothetical protein JWM80_1627 [Cyanobacteria bacterium RYN_339]|nr:hypothetical protein [Cyanobacteria bacterium RYN_339]